MDILPERESEDQICDICAKGRQHKESATGTREKAQEILEVVHSDICGPMQVTTLNGQRYFITFIDEMSGRVGIALLHRKSDALTAFKGYQSRAERGSGKKIQALRLDGGGEYTSREFAEHLKLEGIKHIVSPPYNPRQNGLAERMNRTIMETARCLLEDSKLGKEFWGYAVLTATHIHNQLPSRSHENRSPIEHWTGKVPGIGHLRVFGSTAWVYISKENRQKLDSKSVKCILVGYEEDAGTRVYRLLDPATKKLILSRDVMIDEKTDYDRRDSGASISDTRIEVRWEPKTIDAREEDNLLKERGESESLIEEEIDDNYAERSNEIQAGPETPAEEELLAESPAREEQPELRRSKRERKPVEFFRPSAWYALAARDLEPEPQTLTAALSGTERDDWRKAWESEIESLEKNKTWVVENLPSDRIAVGCRWLFKRKEDGRYKARLVAKGYSQQNGIDYQETFAPVAKFTTIRLLLALVSEEDWEIIGMDVKTAFLNSQLKETVYMELPEGMVIPKGKRDSQTIACRLLKSIYGLKQSPRAWYSKINSFFSEQGFSRNEQDHSMFIHRNRQIILILYVDDLVLAAPTKDKISWIRNTLHQKFEMTDLGNLTIFLGLEIRRNRQARTLHLSQTTYIQKILDRERMHSCNPATTPADPNVRLEKCQLSYKASEEDKKRYQSAVGSLMYAMLGTRPDIAYAVAKVSQYSVNPGPAHWTAVKRILRYLAGTQDLGLSFQPTGKGKGLTDADWGSGEDRKSVGGYTFLLGSAAICWNSKKQSCVALSSTEAEYMALTQAVKESIWLQAVLSDLTASKHQGEVKNIHVDNQGAIALAKNPEFHVRTKHIDIQYHFIREHIDNQNIVLTYCPTADMTADIFTKALPQPAFLKHRQSLGLMPLSQSQSAKSSTNKARQDDSRTAAGVDTRHPSDRNGKAPVRGGIVNHRRFD